MSNNTGFMNFPIETAAAFPSQTAAALLLPSTVQSSLDPLSVNDPWASAVETCTTVTSDANAILATSSGTEFWPQTGQPQQWSTPRSPLGWTGPPPTTLQGLSANNWQSPLPPPPTAVDRMPHGMPFMEISDRDPIPKWDFQEPGARLRPWLRELSFWRHDTSTLVNKHGVKLYKALPLGTIGRSLADQFSEDQICSSQGFDLIIGAIRHHFRSYLEVSKRNLCGIHLANQQQTS